MVYPIFKKKPRYSSASLIPKIIVKERINNRLRTKFIVMEIRTSLIRLRNKIKVRKLIVIAKLGLKKEVQKLN